MSITRGEFLKSLGKSLPGLVASTGVATAAEAMFRRVAAATRDENETHPPPALQANELVSFLRHGPVDRAGIALTFDDGPVPGVTERILDTLRAHGVHATFFMIGEKVAAAPELARRVLAEGHELGHHTYTHRKPTVLSDAAFDEELDQTNSLFEDVLGRRAAWFRPPFGALRQDQARRVRERGMTVALWSLDSEDWRDDSAASVSERILTHLHPGAIVLGHDVLVTANSLDTTLQRLGAGNRFHTLTLTSLTSNE